MGTHKTLKISYTNDEGWFTTVVSQLKAAYTEDEAHFDNEIGKGRFYKVDIDRGIQAHKLEMEFHQPVVFSRKITSHRLKGRYTLFSNLSDPHIDAIVRQQQFRLGFTSHIGIYFSSPFLPARFSFQPNVRYHLLFIFITHERIKSFIKRQPKIQYPFLQTIIDTNKPIYHAESLDAGLILLLKDIDGMMDVNRPNNLLLHSKILELCYKMLQKINQRNSHNVVDKVHNEDIRRLNDVRQYLLNNYKDPCPPINEVAKRSVMSPTKFKKLFKQMFGHTYYQYYKNVRMHKAWELLDQHKMNASEVAYLLGYNNVSKFSKAFKNVFSITPGKLPGS